MFQATHEILEIHSRCVSYEITKSPCLTICYGCGVTVQIARKIEPASECIIILKFLKAMSSYLLGGLWHICSLILDITYFSCLKLCQTIHVPRLSLCNDQGAERRKSKLSTFRRNLSWKKTTSAELNNNTFFQSYLDCKNFMLIWTAWFINVTSGFSQNILR